MTNESNSPASPDSLGDAQIRGLALLAKAKAQVAASEHARAEAFDNTFHKIKAEVSRDWWNRIWNMACAWQRCYTISNRDAGGAASGGQGAPMQPVVQWGPIIDALDGLPGDVRDDCSELRSLILAEHEKTLAIIDADRSSIQGAPTPPADYPPTVSKEQALEGLNRAIKRLQMDIDDGSRPDQWSMQAIQENIRIGRRFIEQSGRSGVSADPLPLADEKLDSQVHDHTDTHIYATIEAACWGEYSVEASRESERDDWYMVVTAPNGIKDYDGTWRRSYDKGLDEVLQQAIDGAMLRAVPSPNLSAMVAAQQHQVKKGELS